MQKGVDLAMSISALRDFSRVNVPVSETALHIAAIQPKYKEQWNAIYKETSKGSSLADALRKQRIWPEWAVAAVSVGEVSGKLAEVMDKVRAFLLDQAEVMKVIKSKVIFPVGFILLGVLTFIGFMIFVFPGVTDAIEEQNRTGLVAVSDYLVNLYKNHLYTTLALIAVVIGGLVFFFKQPPVKNALYSFADRLPGIGDGLRGIYLGFWARFMALLYEAGDISFDEMVRISSTLTPGIYHESFDKMKKDAQRIGLQKAVDHRLYPPSDMRNRWPLRLKVGLEIGAQTGNIGESLGTMAPDIVEAGRDQLETSLKGFGALATGIAAAGIVAPFLGLMYVQFQMASNLG